MMFFDIVSEREGGNREREKDRKGGGEREDEREKL